MQFNQPTDFVEAVTPLARRKLLPTAMTSSELRGLSQNIRNTSFFSAQTLLENLLQKYKDVVTSIVSPVQEFRTPQSALPTTTGLNPTKAREQIQTLLDSVGYKAAPGDEGTIKDLASTARIDLVVKTNSQLAWGAGQHVQQNANPIRVQDYPALELYRLEDRKQPRNWPQRWKIAAEVSGDAKAAAALGLHGRMVALKSSPIWQALGDGAGGYSDTLGNPYAPFAFETGMWTEDVSRDDAEELGLLDEDEQAEPAPLDLTGLFTWAGQQLAEAAA